MSDDSSVCTLEVKDTVEPRPIDISNLDDDALHSPFHGNEAFLVDVSSTIDVHRLDSSSDWLQDAIRALKKMGSPPLLGGSVFRHKMWGLLKSVF